MKTKMIQKAILLGCGLMMIHSGFAQRGRGFERREREEHEERYERNEHNERFERDEHRDRYDERPRTSVNLSIGGLYGNGYGYYRPSTWIRPYAHIISPPFLHRIPIECAAVRILAHEFRRQTILLLQRCVPETL